eukprot:15896_1
MYHCNHNNQLEYDDEKEDENMDLCIECYHKIQSILLNNQMQTLRMTTDNDDSKTDNSTTDIISTLDNVESIFHSALAINTKKNNENQLVVSLKSLLKKTQQIYDKMVPPQTNLNSLNATQIRCADIVNQLEDTIHAVDNNYVNPDYKEITLDYPAPPVVIDSKKFDQITSVKRIQNATKRLKDKLKLLNIKFDYDYKTIKFYKLKPKFNNPNYYVFIICLNKHSTFSQKLSIIRNVTKNKNKDTGGCWVCCYLHSAMCQNINKLAEHTQWSEPIRKQYYINMSIIKNGHGCFDYSNIVTFSGHFGHHSIVKFQAIKCKCSYSQMIDNHLYKNVEGCTNCNRKHRVSGLERETCKWYANNKYCQVGNKNEYDKSPVNCYLCEYSFPGMRNKRPLRIDFLAKTFIDGGKKYIEEVKEVDGYQHFYEYTHGWAKKMTSEERKDKLKTQMKRDSIKNYHIIVQLSLQRIEMNYSRWDWSLYRNNSLHASFDKFDKLVKTQPNIRHICVSNEALYKEKMPSLYEAVKKVGGNLQITECSIKIGNNNNKNNKRAYNQ